MNGQFNLAKIQNLSTLKITMGEETLPNIHRKDKKQP
jgi:hypothetical protein